MLIPCVDLREGQAVQLVNGRRRELAVADVLGLLKRFGQYRWLHVIDLDAAMRRGHNNKVVKQLCQEAKGRYEMKLRVGGGIRTARRAEALVRLGVDQIIVGSAAFRKERPNLRLLKNLADRVGRSRILIALDTAAGRIVVHGWQRALSLAAGEVMPVLEPHCGGFLCTDVDREGTMRGANLAWFRELRKGTKLPIVAAGEFPLRGKSAPWRNWEWTRPSAWRCTKTVCADTTGVWMAVDLSATVLLQYDRWPCAFLAGLLCAF